MPVSMYSFCMHECMYLTWSLRSTLLPSPRYCDAGQRQQSGPPSASNAGECTIHARNCGVGAGVFFLVQKCSVLLVRGPFAIIHSPIYLDSHGEVVDAGRGQNRPLFLSQKRYRRLQELYLSHSLATEVVRQRASSDTHIKSNWYWNAHNDFAHAQLKW